MVALGNDDPCERAPACGLLHSSREQVEFHRQTYRRTIAACIRSAAPTELEAAGTLRLLEEAFSRVDALTGRDGLEKIKTIGDAYMAVRGLPDPVPDGAPRGRSGAELAKRRSSLPYQTKRATKQLEHFR